LLPTRVLDLGEISLSQPHLLETLGQRGKYIALSHRWGGATIAMTTKSNYSKYQKSVPTAVLCKTFLDAIEVTRSLNCRFLWIDSLCIIQDSAEDWAQESARMADVYSQAHLTLSASCATSGDTGLEQVPPPEIKVEVPYYGRDNQRRGSFFVSNRRISEFDLEVVDGPLNERGWTLQERLLSQRIIHFGKTQTFWECQSTTKSEHLARDQVSVDRYGGHTSRGFTAELSSFHWHSPTSLSKRDGKATGYAIWYSMLEHYTRRELTYGEDKLPAVSGLARRFADRKEVNYIAGLWQDDLPIGLLWRAASGRRPLSRPQIARAPSWSWASLDGI
jgi:hypothetical protein